MTADSFSFVVSSKHELVALHKALYEAKFSVEPHDSYVSGSPMVAEMANRVVDLLSQEDPRWHEWRKADQHPQLVEIAKEKIKSDHRWRGAERFDRLRIVRDYLAPLVPSDDLLSELVGL